MPFGGVSLRQRACICVAPARVAVPPLTLPVTLDWGTVPATVQRTLSSRRPRSPVGADCLFGGARERTWENMPPLPPANGVVRLLPQFNYNGEKCNNVLHYKGDSAYTQTDLENLCAAWRAIWDTRFKPIVPATLSLDYITAIDLSPNPIAQVDWTTGMPIIGTDASPSLPNHVTVAVSFRTAQRGRSYRGRAYHVGLTEADVTANTVASAHLTSMQTAYEDIMAVSSGAAVDFWKLHVLSYFSNGSVRQTPVATLVTGIAINPTIDSQRRRLPGRGR
jgi:hypothetical protein